ncbi:uncharacterized protein LOC142774259 [Rhipicephalus microplus]|uniref:uncharacterized protein LOC142774259 n=1 Tax=Rhipicephalus microplus TaxID=6941 RepID=UPI003F6D8E90
MADEEKLPRYSAIGSGSYSQTHQSATCQDYASYEEDWNIILNYLCESANGNPPIPQSPDANFSADIKAANDQNGGTAIAYECPQVTDNKTVLLLSTFSSIACDDAVPSTSRADQAGASTGNSASRRTRMYTKWWRRQLPARTEQDDDKPEGCFCASQGRSPVTHVAMSGLVGPHGLAEGFGTPPALNRQIYS